MPSNKNESSHKVLAIVVLLALVLTLAVVGLRHLWKPATETSPTEPDAAKEAAQGKVKAPQVLDYNQLESDSALQDLMAQRKAEYGVEKGLDMIVKPDESIRVGQSTISMEEILEQIRLREGGIIEKSITESPNSGEAYGVYVVQPGDNIWNIHFDLLRDYLQRKGVSLASQADEPNQSGYSSGVGKLLKFSESLVYIFNVQERKIDVDLNIIEPLSKVVIYNMQHIFALLDTIDYSKINRLQFDGETLWMPADQ